MHRAPFALYANGKAISQTRSSNNASTERTYFGTDLLGTVRSATRDSGSAQYYNYDVFGKPLGENISDFAYTGKPYDPTTSMYNYGYRDYTPQTARFTTVDPIRDGSNWFVYCNNEPVNWVDAWGLSASEGKETLTFDISVLYPSNLKYYQEIIMNAEMYQPNAGGPYNLPGIGKTWCNQSTFDIADMTGFNQKALYDGENRYTVNANKAISNLEKAVVEGKVSKTASPVIAQKLANNGFTVIAGKPKNSESGHLTTVTPFIITSNYGVGAMVANVGKKNDTMRVINAFGTTEGVFYYYDLNQTFKPNGNGLAKEME